MNMRVWLALCGGISVVFVPEHPRILVLLAVRPTKDVGVRENLHRLTAYLLYDLNQLVEEEEARGPQSDRQTRPALERRYVAEAFRAVAWLQGNEA